MSKLSYLIFRLISYLHQYKVPILPFLINKLVLRLCFGFQIGVTTKVGKGVVFGYGGLGVVIHERAVLGDCVHIGSGVTIGGTSKKHDVPVIGSNTIISTGAKIIGPIVVGKNCVVGANCVVVNNVPDNSLIVGIPGRIIKRDIDIKNY